MGLSIQNYDENINSTYKSIPTWLDTFIYDHLYARYLPNHLRYEYNLDLNPEELLVYLGTYFPRSYIECQILFQELCRKTRFENIIFQRESIQLLDFGCGSGGELFGFLSYAESSFKNLKEICILAIDGNQGALRLFEAIMQEYKKHSRLKIEYQVGPTFVENEEDLSLITSLLKKTYDIIISFKAICELISHKRITENAYQHCASMFASHLADEGLMLFVDVTIHSDIIGQFLPQYMNTGLNDFIRKSNGTYSTILPTSCRKNEQECKRGCFFKKVIAINHSRKTNDISKIAYRFIGKIHLVDKISKTEINDIECKYK